MKCLIGTHMEDFCALSVPLGTESVCVFCLLFVCVFFQYTYTGEFIVPKKRENHYLYHDTQTQLHPIILLCSYNLYDRKHIWAHAHLTITLDYLYFIASCF